MKRAWIFICLFSIIGVTAQAQYKSAVGLRLGFSQGVSYKQLFGEKYGLDAIIASRGSAINFTVVFIEQKNINQWFGVNKGFLNWYYGIGSHLGSYGRINEKYDGLGSGLDGALGLEYDLENLPFVIALDYRLVFDIGLNSKVPWLLQDAGLILRYKLN